MSRAWRGAAVLVAVVMTGAVLAGQTPLPSYPGGRFGRSITGAYEGWYDEKDGWHVFLVGYYNRNLGLAMDVPVGPNNHIEPGGPDFGQPTHFLPGRQVGVFTVKVPATFSKSQALTWTITANGETTAIPLRLNTDYNVSPFEDAAVHNTPPVVSFVDGERTVQGPTARVADAFSRSATVGTPLNLPLTVRDDAKYTSGTNAPLTKPRPPVAAFWSLYRGPADVVFAPQDGRLTFKTLSGGEVGEPYSGSASGTATFSKPGEYILLAVANDYSGPGGAGEVCCWTTAMLRVRVEAAASTRH